jgi:hypothetical protein
MSDGQLFGLKTWQQVIRNFAKEMYIPSPVVTVTLADGSSLSVRNLRITRTFVLLEAYDQEGGVALRFVPWANIRDIEVRKDQPEVMEKMGYRL